MTTYAQTLKNNIAYNTIIDYFIVFNTIFYIHFKNTKLKITSIIEHFNTLIFTLTRYIVYTHKKSVPVCVS